MTIIFFYPEIFRQTHFAHSHLSFNDKIFVTNLELYNFFLFCARSSNVLH